MDGSRHLRLLSLSRVLRSRVTCTAYYGLAIAVIAILVATVANAFIQEGGVTIGKLWNAQLNNPTLWLLDAMPFVFLLWGQYVGLVVSTEASAMVLDETETLRGDNAALAAEARRSQRIDSLTGLINRSHFVDSLQAAIESAYLNATWVGVIVLDLDGFSEINEHYGQASGDRVLIAMARRLERAVPESSTLGRLDADRFGVAIMALASQRELEQVAERIRAAVTPPCPLDGMLLQLAASAGGAYYPDNASDAYGLIDAASQTMYEVKSRGGDFSMACSTRRVHGVAMHSLSAELRRAIDKDELVLHLQPLVDASTCEVYGAEALVRWQHPRRGLIMPGDFIPRAERSGLINDLTLWVLRRAVEYAGALRRDGRNLRISINVSARSILRPDFADTLEALLAVQGLPGAALTLELTEDTLMADQTRTLEVMTRLAGRGVQVSIDDFGTGYSQLSYLKRLPVAEIKIDRSFVQDMLESDTDLSIVSATIGLAHALNLRAVGEGVESAGQLDRLRELGCDLIQGFHIGRPMPLEKFQQWLGDWDQRHA
ncbi:bifunctional diguanylate cyclase/phosphodiesterase [Salinisphaera sp. LB1]|uniref:putative bifunctional diguanylate cyclase/phosphodiesterase n=1 Tax=Salinisphaera sp. LB1 TaxID=2183911 RepID=UPI000D7D437B|nr:bifunctional diguanylate cyclase/phosphodiesterase [Salinisphaera sp. LB1]AWN17637.1 diguanylate cyclase/phosphodiesterase (GGDEF & EAL domains) with PAS/PAC sensor(s) [Salinisphaera sp. LB1]